MATKHGYRISEDQELFIRDHYLSPIHWIAEQIGVSPNTVWRHVKRYRSSCEISLVKDKSVKIGVHAAKSKAVIHRVESNRIADDVFKKYSSEPEFLFGCALYWGEGTKQKFQFTNTDKSMIRFFVEWTKKYIPNTKISFDIRLPDISAKDTVINFWSDVVENPKVYEMHGKKEMGLVVVYVHTNYVGKYFIIRIMELLKEWSNACFA